MFWNEIFQGWRRKTRLRGMHNQQFLPRSFMCLLLLCVLIFCEKKCSFSFHYKINLSFHEKDSLGSFIKSWATVNEHEMKKTSSYLKFLRNYPQDSSSRETGFLYSLTLALNQLANLFAFKTRWLSCWVIKTFKLAFCESFWFIYFLAFFISLFIQQFVTHELGVSM